MSHKVDRYAKGHTGTSDECKWEAVQVRLRTNQDDKHPKLPRTKATADISQRLSGTVGGKELGGDFEEI